MFAEGDPFPIFLSFFIMIKSETRRLEPVEDPRSRHSFENIIMKSGEEAGTVHHQ
jgi:hypothetical protein